MPDHIEKPGCIDEISSPPAIRLPEMILSAGLYHQAAGCHPNPQPIPPGREVVEVMTGGRGWVRCGEEWREVTPGDLLWHLPGEETIGRSDWENPYRCLAIRFSMPSGERQRVAPRFSRWDDADEVMRFAREVIRWKVDEGFGDEALVQYVHGRLLFQVELWQRQQRGGATLPPRLARALELIQRGGEADGAFAQIAREVGWSASHLHEMFRQHLGTTPYRYLLERRLRRARERLAVTNDSVKEIAAGTGFSGAAAFCHAFRQRVGMTPLEYRRRMVPGG